jgi:branched-subunit amino acid transport protein
MNNEAIMIAGMALVTIAVRYPVLALVGKIDLPKPVFRALRFVPPAVLAAIILPALLYRDDQVYIAADNSYLVAGIVAGLVAWRSKNLLLTIVLGMLALWGWRALLALM